MLALSSVNLAIPKGRVVGLLGPNARQNNLYQDCAGLLTPSAGNIFVDSKPVSVDTKRIVSYLPDRTYFSKSIRVKECLELFADFYQDFDMEAHVRLLKDHQISTDAKMKQIF